MAPLVLITRPIEQARQFAEQVTAAGYTPLIYPLLNIQPIPTFLENADRPDAIVLSSVQSVNQLQIPSDWSNIPTFCVGGITAQAARDAGLQNIMSGSGGFKDLAPMIEQHVKPETRLLYLRGEHVHQDINALLPQYDIRDIVTYRAQAVTHFAPHILDQFDKINVITLFSARTASILDELIEKNALTPYVKNIKLLSLSPSVVESVQEKNWKNIHIAHFPTQTAMIDTLKSI